MKSFKRSLAALGVALAILAPLSAAAQSTAKTEQIWFPQARRSSPISVTTSSAATALPASGFVALVCNTGSADAYLAFGATSGVTVSATNGSWLKAGLCGAYDLNPRSGVINTFVAAITASSSTSLYVETGTGTPVGIAGGSGSGGGGAVTIADGADVTQGALADAAVTNPASSASVVAALKGTLTDLGAPGATACTTDTASCSLNALLQRNNQRITSMIAALGTPMQQTGGSVTATQGTYTSSGAQQNALPVTTNTQLTVPANTKCAYITVEVASVRRTSDTTSASTTNGTLFAAGAQWSDCGPLAAYKFTAVSGSPTLTVEYFK